MRGSILPGVSESLWHATPAGRRTSGLARSLPGDVSVDVAIVGAGYTGLWTAYALKQAEPTLRIVVCERETVGLRRVGPQRRLVLVVLRRGRRDRIARPWSGRDAARHVRHARRDRARCARRADRLRLGARRHGPGCDATMRKLRACTRRARRSTGRWGFGDDDYRVLAPDDARKAHERAARPTSVRCSRRTAPPFIPRSSRGVWRVWSSGSGCTIYERTAVDEIEPGMSCGPHTARFGPTSSCGRPRRSRVIFRASAARSRRSIR